MSRHWAPSACGRRRAPQGLQQIRRPRRSRRGPGRPSARRRLAGTRSQRPPPSRHATTGTPCISASAAASPNPSRSAGIRQHDACARIAGTRVRVPLRPTKRTASPRLQHRGLALERRARRAVADDREPPRQPAAGVQSPWHRARGEPVSAASSRPMTTTSPDPSLHGRGDGQPPASAAIASAGRPRCRCGVGSSSASVARHRGHDARPAEHRTGQHRREREAIKQPHVGPVTGQHQRARDRCGESGRDPPVRVHHDALRAVPISSRRPHGVPRASRLKTSNERGERSASAMAPRYASRSSLAVP